jgi:hypothetical protein
MSKILTPRMLDDLPDLELVRETGMSRQLPLTKTGGDTFLGCPLNGSYSTRQIPSFVNQHFEVLGGKELLFKWRNHQTMLAQNVGRAPTIATIRSAPCYASSRERMRINLDSAILGHQQPLYIGPTEVRRVTNIERLTTRRPGQIQNERRANGLFTSTIVRS